LKVSFFQKKKITVLIFKIILEEQNSTTKAPNASGSKKDGVRKESFPGFKVKPVKPDEESGEGENEENVGEAEETQGGNTDNDSISITPPDKDSSVAEAKPVGKQFIIYGIDDQIYYKILLLLRFGDCRRRWCCKF
jgi:hypothetical protein